MKKAPFSRENAPRGILKPQKIFALATLAQETPRATFSRRKMLHTNREGGSENPFQGFLPHPFPPHFSFLPL